MTDPVPVVRPLTADDAAVSARLRSEAFGMRPEEPTPSPPPGSTAFGSFVGDQLVARLTERQYLTHCGPRLVPTAGIGGVTVVAEARGQGLLAPLLSRALTEARDRGAVLSTLHPSAPAIYRRFGYEVVTDYVDARVPTAVLARVRPGTGITLRRADLDDVPAIRAVYGRWASGHNGPLSRTGPSFPDQDQWVRATDAVTVAECAGEVCGYVAWDRGTGVGGDATLEVTDLVATSVEAYRSLLHTLGQFAMVTPAVDITSSGSDPIRLLLPANDWQVHHRSPYMLRLLDVEQAFSGLSLPGLPPAREMIFTVSGDFLPGGDGSYALTGSAAGTTCRRIEDAPDAPVFTPGGLAALWAGAHSCATLRSTGLVSGSDADDAYWNLVSGGRSVHVRDYF